MRMLHLASSVATARPNVAPQCRALSSSAFARIEASVSAGVSSSSDSTNEPPSVGAVYSTSQMFTASDVATFAHLTGDPNPIHRDIEAAKSAGFKAPVVHGMLLGSLFGAIIGTRFPGAVYATQTLAFRKPVTVGQTVTAEVTITKLTGSKAMFETKVVVNGSGGESISDDESSIVAVDGTALALLPNGNR